MVDHRVLIREFTAAWRRGDGQTAEAIEIQVQGWAVGRPAFAAAHRTILEVRAMVPFGTSDSPAKDERVQATIPYRCPVKGCTDAPQDGDLVTHLARAHSEDGPMPALLSATSGLPRRSKEIP